MGDELLGHPGTTPRASVDLASGANAERAHATLRKARILLLRAEIDVRRVELAALIAQQEGPADEPRDVRTMELDLMTREQHLECGCGACLRRLKAEIWEPDARSTDGGIVVPGSHKTPPQVERREP